MMSGIASPVYGSSSGSSGTKLPSTVAYFAGEVRNNPIDWGEGGVLAVVWEPSVASTEITEDTQISGGLWATATGLEFRDGTNVAGYPCVWGAGDQVVGLLATTPEGRMKLGRFDGLDVAYGAEVAFSGTIDQPVPGGDVKRVISMINPTIAQIKKMSASTDIAPATSAWTDSSQWSD